MAMTSSNGSGGVSSEINVTPLIDVLLVLLIIFMVLHAVGNSLEYKINQDVVSKDALSARLAEIYANRAERVMFIKGDDDVSYSQVAEVIDMGHSAGVDHVALLTPKVAAGL